MREDNNVKRAMDAFRNNSELKVFQATEAICPRCGKTSDFYSNFQIVAIGLSYTDHQCCHCHQTFQGLEIKENKVVTYKRKQFETVINGKAEKVYGVTRVL